MKTKYTLTNNKTHAILSTSYCEIRALRRVPAINLRMCSFSGRVALLAVLNISCAFSINSFYEFHINYIIFNCK